MSGSRNSLKPIVMIASAEVAVSGFDGQQRGNRMNASR
jgi:hypothetical protein